MLVCGVLGRGERASGGEGVGRGDGERGDVGGGKLVIEGLWADGM